MNWLYGFIDQMSDVKIIDEKTKIKGRTTPLLSRSKAKYKADQIIKKRKPPFKINSRDLLHIGMRDFHLKKVLRSVGKDLYELSPGRYVVVNRGRRPLPFDQFEISEEKRQQAIRHFNQYEFFIFDSSDEIN